MPQGRCTLDLNSTLRAPDDALASRYQLRIGLLLKERPESGEFSQILQTLPERGFNLTYLCTSLLLVLALSAAVLKVVLPTLRRNLRWRIAGSLLLGNLTFVLLHGFVVFAGEFLLWSGFRPNTTTWPGAAWCWAGASALAGFNLYMGLVFTALSGIGLLANFMKIAIYGYRRGTISATWWRCCASCWSSTRCRRRWAVRSPSSCAGASPCRAGSCAPWPPPPPSLHCACSPPRPATSCWGPTFATWTERSTTTGTSSARGPASICSTWWTMLQRQRVSLSLQINEFTLSSATSA
ncbi:hypothetical protein H2136_19460 [Aeromonas hydrophila]|uniref:Uncharacterized protein n=1 Tax=Aeromonas hydrophila TaxID=644 RepID=A0A926FPP0_AERHY|nr:hypothetical protein [Aeromonas hydrophila]